MDEREKAIRQRLKDDFPHYSTKCLKIRTKSGQVIPFSMNTAQQHIHACIEEQLAVAGKVRAIILKGRQQGCSTYVEGRYYWKVTHAKGMRAFILTHMSEATDNLFELAQRYHDNCPALVRPHTSYSNAKELHFDKLDSGYKVGTAGSKGAGRGSTIQYFHGSEVAFWDNAETHAAGVLQAVPDDPGTEIIKESTANGLGNYFHKEWQLAEAGQSDYIAIFVPWYWQEEYSRDVPADFVITVEEEKYMEAYELTVGQMVWRRAKISELGDLLFKQEYPATAAEAFQMSGHDPYIPAQLVVDARNAKAEALGPRKLGVDPARFGDDRTSLCYRQGRKIHWIRSYEKRNTMEVAGLVYKAIKEIGAEQCAVDVGGLGAGVYDRLEELLANDNCHLVQVNSSSVPIDEVKYTNKRAEMWGETKEWLATQPADVPDDDELQADLTQIKYSYDSSNRLRMEKKEDMKKRGLRSPDKADSLGLTFAEPVKPPKKKSKSAGPRRPNDPGMAY